MNRAVDLARRIANGYRCGGKAASHYRIPRNMEAGGRVPMQDAGVAEDRLDQSNLPQQFDEYGQPVPEGAQAPTEAIGSGIKRAAQGAYDWWQQQPSWMEQARRAQQTSDPHSLRPSPEEFELAMGMVGPAGITKASKVAGSLLKAEDAQAMFRKATGYGHGEAPTDLGLHGRGDVLLPPGVTPKTFGNEVDRLTNDVMQFNNPDRRYWYEKSGTKILQAVGGDPEMADRVTAQIAKTSQATPVLDNAAYTARGHAQAMLGEPVKTGRYPNEMGKIIEGYYTEPTPGVIGKKITGYQSGFRSSWAKGVLNEGANDRWNMRWLGYPIGNDSRAFSTGEHNYDRLIRSAVTDRLNRAGFDGGDWEPGQVQAVGWARQRAGSGIPEEQASYDIAQAMHDRAMQLHYESAPGKTSGHFPEYHDAPFAAKQEYHDAINKVLQDELGRDRIAAHMGLLTLPTRHGIGVYEGAVSPGSAARVVSGNAPGGWQAGIDPATRELVEATELTRGLLLRQDAIAAHYPLFRDMPMQFKNTVDVRTGLPLTEAEAARAAALMAKETGSTFFNPIHTEHGYRFINAPEVSGVDNKAFQQAVDRTVRTLYPGEQEVHLHPGFSDTLYQPEDWSKTNGQGYLARGRSFRPDVQRRMAEVLAALGPAISRVEAEFAKRYGWTANPASRVWERNPAYAAHQAEFAQVPVGKPPLPWLKQQRPFDPATMRRRGGRVAVNMERGGAVW